MNKANMKINIINFNITINMPLNFTLFVILCLKSLALLDFKSEKTT
ncbi:hypothetical protein EMUCRT_0157 [Ehrlichia cf. muris str. EmCRT]|uniref:Uncharacterized protein n=1 Tax=Ehrlichia cf. muris str. EmCRT TaxID=1359167 RepID=A0A0F3NE31_9RICK|nr:hypothetical protein EMUCRT_0157 [Ehrlichia cf. muris str. EmCRT]